MTYRYGHRPRCTIVVLSHRWRTHPDMVRHAVDSALYQTEPDVEVRVEFCEANWPTKLNDAMSHARGEWVLVLCDDDQLDRRYVARCLAEVALWDGDADVVYTDRKIFRNADEPSKGHHFRMHGDLLRGPQSYKTYFKAADFLFGQSLPMTHLVRRTLWEELGGHDPEMPHSDTEFWYRLVVRDARFLYVPEPLFFYREHADQMCRHIATQQAALQQFHRKHFLSFGVAYAPSHTKGEVPGRLIGIGKRLAYQATHLTSLTSTGYMAYESKPLPDTAKIAIQLKQREAERAINELITLALDEAGLSTRDGWKVDPDYNAIREVADPPANLDLPAAEAHKLALVQEAPRPEATAVPGPAEAREA